MSLSKQGVAANRIGDHNYKLNARLRAPDLKIKREWNVN